MIRLLAIALCLLTASPAILADSAEDKKAVDQTIRRTVDAVLKVLQDDSLTRAQKKEKVTKIIEPVVDFELMAKLILGRRHWPKLDAKQRKRFTKLLVETLKTSYFDKLVLFSNEKVGYKEPIPVKDKFQAETFIDSKGERISVVYKLYDLYKNEEKRKSAWVVYDFEIEGVSILKSYHAQYGDFLKGNSIEKLLDRMQQKVDAAKKREQEKEEAEKKKGAPAE